jgi:hypothetical protein
MKLLNFLKPKPSQPTIDSYGQPNNVDPQKVQSLMEWLFTSLINAGYFSKSHLIWYDNNNPDPSLEKIIKKLMHRNEPIFLYRSNARTMSAPQGYYWRIISEHPSMQIYQLEAKD